MADLSQTQWQGGPLNNSSGTSLAPNSPFNPPTGETPLGANPYSQYQFGSSNEPSFQKAGSSDAAGYTAFNDFSQQFGRNPTQSELNQLMPAYMSNDPNALNDTGGKAAISAYYTSLSQTPQNIYNQQKQLYSSQAGNFSTQVGGAFQSTLGRAPTDAEKQYYGSLMASGQDQYQIQQALQQTQEGQNVQNTNFQNQLQGQLQQSNSTYFNQYIAPSLQAQNAMSGQAPGSSALSSQLSNAALQQNQGLQSFLAGVTAQNYQNSTGNASNQYNQLMGQQYGLQNAGVSNTLANNAAMTQYNQNMNMYQLQQQAYNQYLQRYGKVGNPALGAIQGGTSGAAAGASFGPYGALIGGVAGAGLGAYGQSSGAARI